MHSEAVTDLEELMDLTPQDAPDSQWRFSAPSGDIGTAHLFGGQLLGQALVAAQRSVDAAQAAQSAHSLHAHFLRAGTKSLPVHYAVTTLRDGRNFSSRRVDAFQQSRQLLSATVSFHAGTNGIAHQDPMPVVPPPDGLEPEGPMHRAVELRPVPAAELPGSPLDPRMACTWMRVRAALPDAPSLHRAMLGYLSDYTLLRAALRPHGLSFRDVGVTGASLDHALWLCGDARADDWLLYCTQSPHATAGRAVCTGRFFSRDGRLVGSVAQEGLVQQPATRPPAGTTS